MQWDMTSAGLAAISLGEILSILACCVFLVAALWACLPQDCPSQERPVFPHLLRRVHDRREELFASHHGYRFANATRLDYLNTARARLSQSPFFHREAKP